MAMCMSHIFDSKSLKSHDCLDGAGGFSSMETGANSVASVAITVVVVSCGFLPRGEEA